MQKKNNPLWFSGEPNSIPMVYLDNAATTYPKPEIVYWAMDYGNRFLAVNAERGSYSLAKVALDGVEGLRSKLLNHIHGMGEGEAVLTPSAMIAMNQIIGGLMLSSKDVVYVSPFEHNAVMGVLYKEQKQKGFAVEELPIDLDTLEIDLDVTEYMFYKYPPAAVFITHVSNVTGYILPVKELFALTKEITKGEGKVILDAAQSFGIVPINYQQTPFDAIVFAGHKNMYGPMGIGGFIRHKDLSLKPFWAGGTGSNSLELTMPDEIDKLEPESPNIPAVTGLYAALSWLEEVGADKLFLHEQKLTKFCVEELRKIKKIQVYVPGNSDKHIGVVSFLLEHYNVNEVAEILDLDYHIAVRAGYHCAPLLHKHLKDKEYGGTLRVSFGWFNTEKDIRALTDSIKEIIEG